MMKHKHIYLLFIPAVLVVIILFGVRIFQYQPLIPDSSAYENQNKDFQIPIYPDDPVLGNPRASKTVIAFEDYGCEGCKVQDMLLTQLLDKHGDKIKIIWKGLPVTHFPQPSRQAHLYGYCANQQGKFVQFKQLAFNNYLNLSEETLTKITEDIELNQKTLQACLNAPGTTEYIDKTEQIATILQIQAVPAIFINNQQVNSPATLSGWEAMLGL